MLMQLAALQIALYCQIMCQTSHGCAMVPFTTQLRQATRDVHQISDKLANARLAFALSDESVWADALLVFYDVFKRLEEYRSELNTERMEMLYVQNALHRKSLFEMDLNKYFGKGWNKNRVIRPEVDAYLKHLEELKEERPLLLLAYVYHLYMGLLSGGQIIKAKRKLRRISFFCRKPDPNSDNDTDWAVEFRNHDIKELKSAMKSAMNTISEALTQEEKYALINESRFVFIYNNTIIKSIKGTNKVILRKLFYVVVIVKVALLLYYYVF